MRYSLIAFLFLFSCASNPSKSVPVESQMEEVIQDGPDNTDTAESGAAAPEKVAGDCVAECVASRQMQASSIEKIESDCQSECAQR